MKQKTTKALSMLLSLLLAAAVLCAAPLTVSAEENPSFASGECGNTITDGTTGETNVQYYVFHDFSVAFFGSGEICDYPPKSDSLQSPSAPWYEEVPMQTLSSNKFSVEDGITKIGASAFSGCSQTVKHVTLPEGLTAIGAAAFYQCQELETVSLPETVKSIGSSAFRSCKNLQDIRIP